MDKVSMIGIDLAKNSFQLHGAWADCKFRPHLIVIPTTLDRDSDGI